MINSVENYLKRINEKSGIEHNGYEKSLIELDHLFYLEYSITIQIRQKKELNPVSIIYLFNVKEIESSYKTNKTFYLMLSIVNIDFLMSIKAIFMK